MYIEQAHALIHQGAITIQLVNNRKEMHKPAFVCDNVPLCQLLRQRQHPDDNCSPNILPCTNNYGWGCAGA